MPVKDTRFKKGNLGRPKGSKNKITNAYLQAIADDFYAHGKSVIEAVRQKRPDVYLKLVAQLVPRDMILDSSTRHFVINAEPELTIEQWQEKHRLSGSTGKICKLN